ncbi:MAG: hypothetical protein AAF483_19360 [Planctomycetota bacterium]
MSLKFRVTQATLAAIFCLCLTNSSLAHDLDDGVVERDCQIVVFPDRVEIQYMLEMNSSTRDAIAKAEKFSLAKTSRNGIPTTDPEAVRKAWDDFREKFATRLACKLSVKIAGKSQKLQVAKSETIEKHSIRLFFTLVAKHKVTTAATALEIADKNFSAQQGYLRMALKGRRGVEVAKSSAPPTVSSLTREPLSKLSKDEQQERRQVQAEFQLGS